MDAQGQPPPGRVLIVRFWLGELLVGTRRRQRCKRLSFLVKGFLRTSP